MTEKCAKCGSEFHFTVQHDDVVAKLAAATETKPDAPLAVVPESTAPTTPQRALARRRPPPERSSVTRTFRLQHSHKDGSIDTMHIYLTAGLYDDGKLCELFIRADKTGTLASGSLDSLATMISIGIQYGIPLEAICEKLRHTRFPPNNWTGDSEFPSCSSVPDLIAQWLMARFSKKTDA
jgi:ribonucleoside-diphosphate reductase alpha chain